MKNWNTLDADVVKLLNTHYTKGRRGAKIKHVVVHYNGGNLTTEGCYSVWQTRPASAHYQVEQSGRIGQLVYDSNTAWHAGNWNENIQSIGIEHANDGNGFIFDKTLEEGAHLTAAICKYYGLGEPRWEVNVWPHWDFSATSCPGPGLGKHQNAQYMERARYWYHKMMGDIKDEPVTPPQPTKKPLPDALKSYRDLDSESWYIGAVEHAVQKGWLHGYSTESFGPNDAVTRAQAVTIIANAAGAEFKHPYSDVSPQPWYYDAVSWAKEQKIVSDSLDNFNPDGVCTREMFATMLSNWKNSKSDAVPENEYDWDKVSDWAKPAVSWAVQNKILGSQGYIRPQDATTRAEACAMMQNLLG